jgi:tRNA(fMet)-specific endonuclease VapC
MIILDSDHLTILQIAEGVRYANLLERLILSSEPLTTTIVNVEEQMRGWLKSIAKEKQAKRQVRAYRELEGLFTRFAKFSITPFDDAAANKFDELRSQKVRIGTMDLKTASIAIVQNALLLTANKRDFEKVPGLRFENWLD